MSAVKYSWQGESGIIKVSHTGPQKGYVCWAELCSLSHAFIAVSVVCCSEKWCKHAHTQSALNAGFGLDVCCFGLLIHPQTGTWGEKRQRKKDSADGVRVHYQYFREGKRGLGQWRRPSRETGATVRKTDREIQTKERGGKRDERRKAAQWLTGLLLFCQAEFLIYP